MQQFMSGWLKAINSRFDPIDLEASFDPETALTVRRKLEEIGGDPDSLVPVSIGMDMAEGVAQVTLTISFDPLSDYKAVCDEE